MLKKHLNYKVFTQDEHSYHSALERLFILRNIAIISQLAVMAIVIWVLKYNISNTPFLLVSTALTVVNIFIYWRLKRDWVVSSSEIAINLLIDILALAVLLYFAGGSTNPLVSLFIVPVALSAVFLPVGYIIWVVALTILLYTLLMEWYIPLPSMGARFGGDFNLHILGMYGNFIFSAIIIAIFVFNLVRVGRFQEQELAAIREKMIRNKHVISTGLLAAHAAHKINTPLATIGLLVDELIASPNDNKVQDDKDLDEIQKQVSYCQNQLQALQQKASIPDNATITPSLTLEEAIKKSIKEWEESHPDMQLEVDIQLDRHTPFAEISSLTQTLINLMDNAADASLQANRPRIDVSAMYSNSQLIIDIDDYGEGLTKQQLKQVGISPYSSKPNGMGIGLLLSHSTLDHLGGHILLNNRENSNTLDNLVSGIRARIILPVLESNEN